MTLFRDLSRSVFQVELREVLPERVLPLSTSPPLDLSMLFDHETSEVKKLLQPKRRRVMEATARLKALAILDGALQGKRLQPTDSQLKGLLEKLKEKSWLDVFPGVAALNTSADSSGPAVQIRLDKKDGIPVRLVPEGTPDATVVAVKRVNELDFYSLTSTKLAEKLNLTMPRCVALLRHLEIDKNPEYFREFRLGKGPGTKRYSHLAYEHLKKASSEVDMSEVWKKYSSQLSGHKRQT